MISPINANAIINNTDPKARIWNERYIRLNVSSAASLSRNEEKWREKYDRLEHFVLTNHGRFPPTRGKHGLGSWMKETREHYKVFISGDRPNCYFFKHVHRLQLLQEIGFPWDGKNPNTPTNPNPEFDYSTNNNDNNNNNTTSTSTSTSTTNNNGKLEGSRKAREDTSYNNPNISDGNVMVKSKSTSKQKSEKSANYKNASAVSVYNQPQPKESQIGEYQYSRDKDPKQISKKHTEEEPVPFDADANTNTNTNSNNNSNTKIGSSNTTMSIDVTSQNLLATILPRPSQSIAKNANTNTKTKTKTGPTSLISTPSYITKIPTSNNGNGNGRSPGTHSSSLSQMKMKQNPVVDTLSLVANNGTSSSTPIPSTANTTTSTTNPLAFSTMATTTTSTTTPTPANNISNDNSSTVNMDCSEHDDNDDEEEPLSTTEMIYQYVEQREKEKAAAALELVKMNSGGGVNIHMNKPRHHGSGATNMKSSINMDMNRTVKHATTLNTINTHKRKVSDSIEIGSSGSVDDISMNAARGKGVFSHTSQKPRLKNILDTGQGMQGVSGAGIGDRIGIGSSGGNSVYSSSFNSNSLSSAVAVAGPTTDFAGHSLSSLSSSGLSSSKAFYPHHQHHTDAAVTGVPNNSKSVTTSTTMTSSTKSKTKPNPIRFTPHVECIEVKKHPESDQMDMLLHLILHIESTHANGNLLVSPVDGDMSNSNGSHQEGGRSSFLVDKWYSDLLMMHELCGLDDLNITFPQIYITESASRETGRRKFQVYMNELANVILNVDYKSRISKKVLFFFDDKTRSLSDKIQIKLLEYRLANTVEYCNFLQKSQHSRGNSVQSQPNSQAMSLTQSLPSLSAHPRLTNIDTPMESSIAYEPTQPHSMIFTNQQSSQVTNASAASPPSSLPQKDLHPDENKHNANVNIANNRKSTKPEDHQNSSTSVAAASSATVAASRKHPPSSIIEPQPLTGVINVHNHDVLSGRGGNINVHAGNKYFRSLVATLKTEYVATPKPSKPMFAKLVVKQIRGLNPPGRFLKKDSSTGLWNDVGEKKALDKTRQALREGAPEIEKELQNGQLIVETHVLNSLIATKARAVYDHMSRADASHGDIKQQTFSGADELGTQIYGMQDESVPTQISATSQSNAPSSQNEKVAQSNGNNSDRRDSGSIAHHPGHFYSTNGSRISLTDTFGRMSVDRRMISHHLRHSLQSMTHSDDDSLHASNLGNSISIQGMDPAEISGLTSLGSYGISFNDQATMGNSTSLPGIDQNGISASSISGLSTFGNILSLSASTQNKGAPFTSPSRQTKRNSRNRQTLKISQMASIVDNEVDETVPPPEQHLPEGFCHSAPRWSDGKGQRRSSTQPTDDDHESMEAPYNPKGGNKDEKSAGYVPILPRGSVPFP